MMDFTKAFLDGLGDCEEYAEASKIIERNSSGRIWLVGGLVYRTIANQLYGSPKPEMDLDFVVERAVETFHLPSGWTVERNSYGNPKLKKGRGKIDYIPLRNVLSIHRRGLKPTIKNFLTGVPLTIQSLAYDIQAKGVIGEIGIDALQRKVVEVNDLHSAEQIAQTKCMPLDEIIKTKAEELGFRPIFP